MRNAHFINVITPENLNTLPLKHPETWHTKHFLLKHSQTHVTQMISYPKASNTLKYILLIHPNLWKTKKSIKVKILQWMSFAILPASQPYAKPQTSQMFLRCKKVCNKSLRGFPVHTFAKRFVSQYSKTIRFARRSLCKKELRKNH